MKTQTYFINKLVQALVMYLFCMSTWKFQKGLQWYRGVGLFQFIFQ